MSMKKEILKRLEYTKNAKEISEAVGCTRQYVYTVARLNGIEMPKRRQVLHHGCFSADKTLKQIAQENGVTYTAARSYARHHDVPYLKPERISPEVIEYVNDMTFLTIDQIRKVHEINRSQLSYIRKLGNKRGEYTNYKVARYLGKYGAESTAKKFGLDAEVLHNLMYVYDNKSCPYSDVAVEINERLRSDIKRGLRGEHL